MTKYLSKPIALVSCRTHGRVRIIHVEMMSKRCGITWIIYICIVQRSLADVGYFWHVTDFHYDTTYDNLRLSCDKQNTPTNIGQYGTYWCDSPWLLVNSSIQAMADIHPNVDFMLWTGDTVLHTSDDNLNYTMNSGILDEATDALKQAFPGTKVYASFGNHDYYPNNQYPPFNNLLYNDTLTRWKDWLSEASDSDSFLKGGYYTLKTQYGLRIVALNTNLYYTSNKAAVNQSDPADQFDWLNRTLTNAATAGEKVMITAHIPPGIHTPNGVLWMYEAFNTKLVDILQEHVTIIVAMHFGHDHADSFKLMLDKNGDPGAPLFIAPSVTPWKYIPTAPEHNPGIRLVKYDRQTGNHLEIQQYFLDILEANRTGVANWVQEYNTTHAYSLDKLTASSLSGLIDKMKNSNGIEFTRYWKHFTVTPRDLAPCDQDCHSTIMCGYTYFDQQGLTDCKNALISNSGSLMPALSLILMSFFVAYIY